MTADTSDKSELDVATILFFTNNSKFEDYRVVRSDYKFMELHESSMSLGLNWINETVMNTGILTPAIPDFVRSSVLTFL